MLRSEFRRVTRKPPLRREALHVGIARGALLLCTLAFATRCAGGSGHATPSTSLRPALSSQARGDAASDIPPQIQISRPEAQLDAATADGTASEPAPPPPPDVELVEETPYRRYERPIAAGSVYAAGLEEELARWNVGGTSDPAFVSNRAGFHPGTRVTVDVSTARGQLPTKMALDRRTGKPRRGLSEQSLLAQARKHGYWPYRLCFETGAREAVPAKNVKVAGDTKLRVRIAATGRVASVRVLDSEVTNRAVARCLAERTEKLTFVPGPPRRLDATFVISLWPGDAPLPERARPAGVTSPESEPSPSPRLNTAALTVPMKAVEPAIRQCFAAGIERDAGLWGRLELRLELDGAGKLLKAAEHQSRFPDAAVAECVLGIVRELSFPGACSSPATVIYAWRLGHLPAPAAPPASPTVQRIEEPSANDSRAER